jgi:hypothetical protein
MRQGSSHRDRRGGQRATADLLTSEDQIPWSDIARLGDLLAHRYFDTSHSILQATADHDLPALSSAIVRLLDASGDSQTTSSMLHRIGRSASSPRPQVSHADPPGGVLLWAAIADDRGCRMCLILHDPARLSHKIALAWKLHRPLTAYLQVRGRFVLVGGTGIEPATSSVSGKRATAAPTAHLRGCSRWRRDLNPCRRLCRPLPRLSATPP